MLTHTSTSILPHRNFLARPNGLHPPTSKPANTSTLIDASIDTRPLDTSLSLCQSLVRGSQRKLNGTDVSRAVMPFIHSSIESAQSLREDPWDWTVEQVVYALCDHDSPLLGSNNTLALPDPGTLAQILRENDINGLALLTLVQDNTIRDELRVRSLSHRASINYLIRQLQKSSSKYQEDLENQTISRGRLSSYGSESRHSSYLSSPHAPWVATRSSRPWQVPRASLRSDEMASTGVSSSEQNLDSSLSRNILLNTPCLPQSVQTNSQEPSPPNYVQRPDSSNRAHFNEGVRSDANLEADRRMLELPENGVADKTVLNEYAAIDSSVVQVRKQDRPGETVAVDDKGCERRRLVLDQSESTVISASSTDNRPTAEKQFLSSTFAYQDESNDIDPLSREDVSIRIEDPTECTSHDNCAAAEVPTNDTVSQSPVSGVLAIDKHGRKRMRPISLSHPQSEVQVRKETSNQLGKTTETVSKDGLPNLEGSETPSSTPQVAFRRKAKRRPDQIYLGIEPLTVDKLFYGDTPVEHKLEADRSSQSEEEDDNFSFESAGRVSKGQRLYVNARLRHFLQCERVHIFKNGKEHIGITPYPTQLGKKHHPLSITMFSRSSDRVFVYRSNRSKWLNEGPYSRAKSASDKETSDAFYVPEPTMSMDEENDSEWKALEKWKYMDEKDVLLPEYGDSGSEGEYDLETWREMEAEGGKLVRPVGQSTSRKLTKNEVDRAIDIAIEQMVQDWESNKKPKLQPKAWALWKKAKRDKTTHVQAKSLSGAIERLTARIETLRKEIAEEEWARINEIARQCKIIQPSLFDREEAKWKLITIKSKTVPEKMPIPLSKPKVGKTAIQKEPLKSDEEDLETAANTSDSSEDGLDGFVVEDDEDECGMLPLNDEDLTMADGESGCDSDTLVLEPSSDKRGAISNSKELSQIHKKYTQENQVISSRTTTIIDLTQTSDSVDSESPIPKIEPSYNIRTPPVHESGNDSEIWFQRSRGKRPVFRVPSSTYDDKTIISLEDSSTESSLIEATPKFRHLPAFSDVAEIKKMNPTELVERQDRKRLLIWLISHTSKTQRERACDLLNSLSMEDLHRGLRKGLQELIALRRHIRGYDDEQSDNIMQIAVWFVCWTIPVKCDPAAGLKTSHVEIAFADEEGFEPFYDFLLDCVKHYEKRPTAHQQLTPKKNKKRKIVRDGSVDDLESKPSRKRKYFVPESQETLDKRESALERLRGDEQRRRREELRSRLSAMGTDKKDPLEVIVNPGKLSDQDFVRLNPRFGNGAHLKAHQKDGLQFLWREVTADHNELQGCLLAQTMGLGKTIQVIALLVTIAETAKSTNKNVRDQVPSELHRSQTLVLCPPALIENWWDEFLLWPPQPLSENVGELRKVSAVMRPKDRLSEIQAWSEEGGVLLMGFSTFRDLILNKTRKQSKTNRNPVPALDETQHTCVKNALLERPSLVVADEAHEFKNQISDLNIAINQIRSKCRIALTGSPLSNNLREYFSIIDWIAPKYLGTYTEFSATYEEPIREGLYQDSTESQYRESRKRLKALELEMEPKVHRADISALHGSLQGKMEFVIRVPLTQFQEKVYRIFVECTLGASASSEPQRALLWTWLTVLQLLCNHPKSFRERILSAAECVQNTSLPKTPTKQDKKDGLIDTLDEDLELLNEPASQAALSRIVNETQNVFDNLTKPLDDPCLSNKMQLLMGIIELSRTANDKVLVFSHRLPTLDFVGDYLRKAKIEFARIDGTVMTQKRQQITKAFNEGPLSVCLISTKAGGQGLNLFGANRVAIMDDHFNPMWEQQAIGRAYRIGQLKAVFVYRLTVGGTFEQAIQNQALFKEQLATRVVDKKNPIRTAIKGAGQYLFLPKTVKQEDLNEFYGKDPLVLDHLLANQEG